MIVGKIWNRIYDDFLMPSELGTYQVLLESGLREGYEIVTVERFWQLIVAGAVDPARRYLILRHDIDTDPRTGAEMWKIDRSLGIASSYYFRLSTLDLDFMSRIAADGGEASYHYEELAAVAKEYRLHDRESVMRHMPEVQDRFLRNLARLREMTGLPMRVVASHGDFVNRQLGLSNWVLLVDPRIRRLADVDLEVYDDALLRHVSHRHSDSDQPRHMAAGNVASLLEARVPVLYLLVHPRNWQARRVENATDDLRRVMEGALFRLPTRSRTTTSHRREPEVASRPLDVGGPGPRDSASDGTVDPGGLPLRHAITETSLSPAERASVLVRAPASYESERRYVLDVVLKEWLGIDYRLEPSEKPGVAISMLAASGGAVLELPDVLFATRDDDWLTERSMPSLPLARLSVDARLLDAPDSTGERVVTASPSPVLFAVPGAQTEFFRKTSTGILFAADVLGSVFYMLSRYEEVARRYRDEHDRYPSYASLASVEGFLERPIVDEYVDVLWAAMHELWPALVRPRSQFRLRLTHDVDQPWAATGQPTSRVLRSLVSDLVRRRDPTLAGRRAVSLMTAQAGSLHSDPYDTFDMLMDTSEQHGLTSTFYFLAGNTNDAIDGRYGLSDPPIRRLLTRIHDRGHDVGLHASYGTYRSRELIQHETDALKAACAVAGFDQAIWGVRHHYLRLRTPMTWRYHELAGLDYDSTLGFADHVGFRAGTCREFPLYDVQERRALSLRERPLIVMDATMYGYQTFSHDRAASKVRAVVDSCRRHQGDAVLLYHNGVVGGTRLRSQYPGIIEDLARLT